jgi:hypothetical protein
MQSSASLKRAVYRDRWRLFVVRAWSKSATRLEIADDLAEETRREESRSKGAGCILADGRQQPQSHSYRRGACDRAASGSPHSQRLLGQARRDQRLRGVCGGTEGMGTHMRGGCGLSGRSSGPAAAGTCTSRAGTPPTKQRRIPSATSSSPRAKARVRAIRSRGRLSPGAAASKIPSTCSAQSAAHAATVRRSASLSVCGERTRPSFQPRAHRVPEAESPTDARRSGASLGPPPRRRRSATLRP